MSLYDSNGLEPRTKTVGSQIEVGVVQLINWREANELDIERFSVGLGLLEMEGNYDLKWRMAQGRGELH